MKNFITFYLTVLVTCFFVQVNAQNKNQSKPDTAKTVYTSVEKVASFPGGTDLFFSFIKKNLHYPDSARIKKIEGIVKVSFVIKEDGTLGDIAIMKGVAADLDAEAIRVINKSPAWAPAIQNGRPVKMIFSVPIEFKL